MQQRVFTYHTAITGHEHLYSFGLINMNGRMYDPLLSSFLSPDNYMQDPTSQQGFNRYAYCMYNPLKYIDPSGERQMGWVYSTYQWEQEARAIALKEQYKVYEVIIKQHNDIVNWMTNSIYTQGSDACGGGGSSGNHGSGGGDQDGPNKQRPLIFIRTVTIDNDLPPTYNFIIFNSNESSGNNTSTYTSEL